MKEKQAEELSHLGKLAKQCVQDSEKWLGNNACTYSISHHSLAMAATVGAFCSTVQRIERGELDPKDAKVRMQLAMGLTDVFVDVLNIAGLMGFDLDRTYMMVRAANEKVFAEERAKREASNGHK